jgi:hypothetical protein
LTWLQIPSPVLYTLGPDGLLVFRSDGKTSLQSILSEHVNTYFSPAETIPGLQKKAGRNELVSTSFVHVDMDPIDGRDPLKEQDRLYTLVTDGRPSSVPAPSAIISSGRGVQCLWKLETPVSLPDGIEAIESVNKWLMDQLQAPPGTFDVSRILRLPGSWNALSTGKIAKGYSPRQAELVEVNDLVYTLANFGKFVPRQTSEKEPSTAVDRARINTDDVDEEVVYVKELGHLEDLYKVSMRVKWLISHGAPGDDLAEYEREFGAVPDSRRDKVSDRSAWTYDVVCQLLRKKVPVGEILGILLDGAWGISGHCLDQADPERSARRQVARAMGTVATDAPKDNQADRSARQEARGEHTATPSSGAQSDLPELDLSFYKLKVKLEYDLFADICLMNDKPLQDADMNALWFEIETKFHFQLAIEKFNMLLQDEARKNSFHPVKDYFDSLVWDKVPRLDTWLIKYGGAQDTPFIRAVGTLPLIAAVRRIRVPGTPFQEILTLVSAQQGTYKSTALQTLCPRREWFTDDLPLNAEAQQVIERLQGHLIVECAETKGMKKGDNEHIKAFLSRRVDKARMAYGRVVKQAPRQVVFIATSNDESLLRDATGNRRWWPVIIKVFDVKALAEDRDQLWAEAVYREAQGESIGLDPSLYQAAGDVQEAHTIEHPFVDVLSRALGNKWGKILAADAWDLVSGTGPRSQDSNSQLRQCMAKLGWKKDRQRFDGTLQTCYTKALNDGCGGQTPGHSGEQIVTFKRKDGRMMAVYLTDRTPEEEAF